jgi:hypothetical protein
MATTIFEDLRVNGEQMLDELRKLLKDGSVKKITLKNKEGKVILEAPLTLGAVGMGGLFLFHPFLSAAAAYALFAKDFRIEVEREVVGDDGREVEAEIIDIQEES